MISNYHGDSLSGQMSDLSSSFIAAESAYDNKKHLLLAASGSVATIKLPNILEGLSRYNNLSVRIVLTKAAENFLAGQSIEQPLLDALSKYRNVDAIYRDENEWGRPWVRGRAILHIELRRWADVLVVAPLSANSLAKMANGLADNLLMSVIRAWDTIGEVQGSTKKRIIVAPAMNTAMWRHPVTKKHMKTLEEDWGIDGENQGWIQVLRPIEKILACGDTGDGAMREYRDVLSAIEEHLNLKDKDI